jgi:Zn-dependent peptidase ImmA (M78 family)
MTVKSINQAAEELLQKFGDISLPIKVEDIARFLGIRVVPYPLENDLSGLLVIEENGAVIGYNQNESRARRRFTVAHELGHYILHKEGKTHTVFADNSFKVLFRSQAEHEDSAIARMEFEANTFAAALLMPVPMLQKEIEDIEFDLGDEGAIKELSRRFEVSSTAMYYRLLNLKLFS